MKRWMAFAGCVAALALAACSRPPEPAPAPAAEAQPQQLRKVRFLMNSGFSGANAWLLVADERGYFRDEGIEVEFVPGRGAFTAAGRMVEEGFDVGYGDIHAVYEQAAKAPGKAPVGVYMVMDRSPSVIILPAASPVTSAGQLAGLTITGHASDVALNTFAQYAAKTGLDAASVTIETNEGNWKVLLGLLDQGGSDALFGYLSTSTAAVRTAGGDVDSTLRFLKFRDAVPELYGSALMVSPRLLREEPGAARGLVRAVNRGLMETLCEPQAAIDILVRRAPGENAEAELGRLRDTVDDMGGAERVAREGVGDIDPSRMRAALKLTAETRRLPRQPDVAEVFDRGLLPEAALRKPCAEASGTAGRP